MAGYQSMQMPTPRLSTGRPAMPIVDIALVRPRAAAAPAVVVVAPPVKAEPQRKTRNVTGAMVKRMREMRAQGAPLREIARTLKCQQKSVWTYTRDIPEPPQGWKKHGYPSSVNRDEVLSLACDGVPRKVIAEMLGVSGSTIDRVIIGGERTSPRDRNIAQHCIAVSLASGIPTQELRTRRGQRRASLAIGRARHVLFWMIRIKFPRKSLLKIASGLGDFDHTACLYGCRRVEAVACHYKVDRTLPPAALARLLLSLDWDVERKAA